ncbi:hypothetical protein HS088_TW06G00274 [Tripterygium wilfordii]|uniref:Uncharacterized protein n=2 Tax=Tripterygium wilfordii TaxID=458696 RepID=A0A7J7DII7_TRIWF|nr:hypothetical protein HS088_TW06G00274 [Tripterygium wilfordii]
MSAESAEVHKMNYSPEANAKLEKWIRQVENAKAIRNQCTTDWKLGYEDQQQRVDHLYNELRVSSAEYRVKLDEILLAGKVTKAAFDESIDDGSSFAKGSSALEKHLDKPNEKTTHLMEVIARTEEAVVIARPEEAEEVRRAYRKSKILVVILILSVGVYEFGPLFVLLLPILPLLLRILNALIKPLLVVLLPLLLPLAMMLSPLILPLVAMLLPFTLLGAVLLPVLLPISFVAILVGGILIIPAAILFLLGGFRTHNIQLEPSITDDRLK